jgi:hypothetical membrane protein
MSAIVTPELAATRAASRTTALLAGGVIAGPLFTGLAVIQIVTRDGFDLRRHAISMLSLGEQGWVQITSFVVSGLLVAACAVGMRRVLHSGPGATWGPLLVGLYGVGLIAAGVFTTDPAMGFPRGAPGGLPSAMSWHAILHSVAFLVAFTSLIAASFVFVRRFAHGEWRWAAYCAATGTAVPALIGVGMTSPDRAGIAFFVAALIGWGWLAAVTARLQSTR